MRKVVLCVVALIAVFFAGVATERLVAGQTVSKTASGMVRDFDAMEVSADRRCTTSKSYLDLPGLERTFRLDGRSAVIVLFQGKWFQRKAAPEVVRIQLMIDGGVQPGLGDDANPLGVHNFAVPDVATNGWNFVSAPLQPGTHIAKIRWQSVNGEEVCVNNRSMIIFHR